MQVIIDGVGTSASLLHCTIEAAMGFKLPDGSTKDVHIIHDSRHNAQLSCHTLLPNGHLTMQDCLADNFVLNVTDFKNCSMRCKLRSLSQPCDKIGPHTSESDLTQESSL